MDGWDESAGGGAFEQQRPIRPWLPQSMVLISVSRCHKRDSMINMMGMPLMSSGFFK